MTRFAYADPPYVGQARKHYGGVEVNQRLLIAYLESDFDAWALSCSSPSLRDLLAWCPPDVRIAAWVKPFAVFKPNVNPAYAWEPVIFKPVRRDRSHATVRDWVTADRTISKDIPGAKPVAFCWWLFALLGVCADDDFTDVFPGTGIVGDTWKRYQRQRVLFEAMA